MEEFYRRDISEEDQIKIVNIKEAMPENIRDFIETQDIQNLLKTDIEKLETKIITLLTNPDLAFTGDVKLTCDKIKNIIYPPQSQTTKINNTNMNTMSASERPYLDAIKNSISFEAQIDIIDIIDIDDDLARSLLKETDENIQRATLFSICNNIDEKKLSQILKDIKEIADSYKLSYAKNLPGLSKNQPKNTAQNGISSELYATDPNIVKGVSDEFKQRFKCEKDLTRDDVKKLLMSDASQRKTVLSEIIKKYKIKEKRSSGLFSILILDNEVSPRDCFLSFVDNIISDFHKSQNNKKVILPKDKIFSPEAVERITKYLLYEYENGDGIIDFTNGVISEQEILDNKMSRFSFTQINKMLNDGVLPERLLAICNFDIYIKYQYLANDILDPNISKSLCEQFIDFLYMDITTGHLDKQDNKNIVTPDFVQTLITKYITEKKLNNIIEINKDPVIYRLFFNKNDVLRDKQAINKLLGNDEQILETFMNAKVDLALLMDIINLPIKWDFSDAWLNKIKSNNSYNDYNEFLGDLIAEKKLKTFTLADLLEGKNQMPKDKNQEIKDLLSGKKIKCGKEEFKLNEKQISQTQVIKVIAQDLDTIKNHLNENENEDKAKSVEFEKLFSHVFWFNNLIDQDFFSQLVNFLEKEILADFAGEIDDINSVDDLKNILQNETLVYLFQNIKSNFVMSVLLNQLLGNYLQIGTWTAKDFSQIFIAFFESIDDNKNFDLNKFQNVFIKTFVAKTKDMEHLGFGIQETVLQFVLNEINNINSLLKQECAEYKFNHNDKSYFDVCAGILESNSNDIAEEEDIEVNVISDLDQESMDNLVFDFLRGKFNLHKEIKNEIVDSNKSNNENKNRINIESKNTVKNNEIKKETDQKKEKINNNKGNFISGGDYLTDEEFDKRFGSGKEINSQNKKQHVLTEKDKKDGDQAKIKTKEIKLECIVDLYNIDKEIVEKIINLNQNDSNVSKFVSNLDFILNDNEHQNQKVKDSIKKCYIDQFFFCKTFTKIALMMHDKTQKDRDENVIDYELNYKKLFKKLFDKQEDIDCNIKNVFDEKDINYFWTVWEKRYAYFKNKINLCQINFEIDNDVDDADQEYEQKYLEGIMKAKKKYNLDKEILKSKNNVELGKYNLHADIIKEIDLQVKSSCTASFETFFFGYLSVLKKTVMEVEAKFKKENLADFQKCYIKTFLMWHRDNKNAETIKKQFLLDMYFFFNKAEDSKKPQNIFGKEIVDYFNSCMKELFNVKDKDLQFNQKLEPLKSSTLNEIQIIEMDQEENLGLWFLEYLDPEKIAHERKKKRDEARKLISKEQNELKKREKTEVTYFNPNTVVRKLPFDIKKEKEKINNGDRIKINDEKKSSEYENNIEHDKKINLDEKDNNQKNSINDKDKNLIKLDEKQKEKIEINNEIKTNDLDDKKEKNEITDTNDSNITNDVQISTEKEETVKKMDIKNNDLQDNQKENNIDNNKLEATIEVEDNQNIELNKKDNIEGMKNDVHNQSEILTNDEKQETKTKIEFCKDNLKINNDTNENLKNNNIIINGNENKNNEADLISTKNNVGRESIDRIGFEQLQNSQTIKINCLHDKNNINEHTEYMSILYGIDINIINDIDSAISAFGFPQNFDFLSPLNQILDNYGRQNEKQIKQYYMDRFFASDIFKTHMQEEEFESVFDFANQNVFDENDINYFKCQWKKTVLLHFDSKQFKNQELKANQNFCFDINYSPSKSYNISKDLVDQINLSVENFKYDKPEDFFRGYYMLFKSEIKKILIKDNQLSIQKYYIAKFLLYHIGKGKIDLKFLRHVDFRFRGYLLKKQTILSDDAIKYFYELLGKLLFKNKENELVTDEAGDEINGTRIKNFEVKINNDFIEAEKNCRNYKIAFWVLIILAVLSGGAIYFSAYFAIPLIIVLGSSIFCFIKKRKCERKISDLVGSGKCLLSTNQIELYKETVKNDIACDIDYFQKIQDDEQKKYDKIIEARDNMFSSVPKTANDVAENNIN